MLIVFEGIDGSGKTTQIKRTKLWLSQQLPDASIVATQEPDRLFRLLPENLNLHRRAELLLYAADRAQHIEEKVKPILSSGGIVLCDRYTDSTLAYQGWGMGCDFGMVGHLNQIATGGLESDLTFWLDVDVNRASNRVIDRGTDSQRFDNSFYYRVKAGYAEINRTQPNHFRINGNGREDSVFNK